MGTRGDWGTAFAQALGNSAPSDSTVNWIASWTKNENTKAAFNPLATTLKTATSTAFNTAGVQNYPDRASGIDATVRTLMGNHTGYEDIREGIRTNDPNRAANGLLAAPWGSNGAVVKLVWQTTDVRAEDLRAEAGANGNVAAHDPGHLTAGLPNPVHTVQGNATSPAYVATAGDVVDSRSYVYIGAGLLLLGVSGWLLIRTYVPTEQLVKTVAKVAAA